MMETFLMGTDVAMTATTNQGSTVCQGRPIQRQSVMRSVETDDESTMPVTMEIR